MPSLKDLKNRIASVKSTRKITSAMKMVAASKLRRAQERAEAARPYVRRMESMLADLLAGLDDHSHLPALMTGTGKQQTVLLILLTSDRGLCGAFNTNVVREARRQIEHLEAEGKTVKLICVGRKGRDFLRRQHGAKFVHTMESGAKKYVDYVDAQDLAGRVLALFESGEFDVARLIYNNFKSAISQVTLVRQIVPFSPVVENKEKSEAAQDGKLHPLREIFEPGRESLLGTLLPRFFKTQIFTAMLENAAGEQGARMSAMDNATRNAGDMIDRLTLNYNRSRQAHITKELIEIISGAEAV